VFILRKGRQRADFKTLRVMTPKRDPFQRLSDAAVSYIEKTATGLMDGTLTLSEAKARNLRVDKILRKLRAHAKALKGAAKTVSQAARLKEIHAAAQAPAPSQPSRKHISTAPPLAAAAAHSREQHQKPLDKI
jgi:hypothetical protein